MSASKQHDDLWYTTLAERATKRALDEIRCDEDASASLSLASAAWSVVMDDASDAVLLNVDQYILTKDGGYEVGHGHACVCPPGLLARGGFSGSCSVHS